MCWWHYAAFDDNNEGNEVNDENEDVGCLCTYMRARRRMKGRNDRPHIIYISISILSG